MINKNNQLVNNFFDDKLNLNFDIAIVFDGKSATLNFDLTFKKKITSFDFEKILSYCKVDVLENENNYKKVTEYFESIFEILKLIKLIIRKHHLQCQKYKTFFQLSLQKSKEI